MAPTKDPTLNFFALKLFLEEPELPENLEAIFAAVPSYKRTNTQTCNYQHYNYTGRNPVRAEGPAGWGHSKIARVCILNWPLPLLTSV